MFLYSYKRGSWDCAVCRAWSKKQAMRKFSRRYDVVKPVNVSRVRFTAYGVAIIRH